MLRMSGKVTAFALSAVLALGGAMGVVAAAAVSPTDAGVVEQAQAKKAKTKKHTMWRGDKAELKIFGLSKKQKKKLKFKSTKKAVATINKKGKITAKKAGVTVITAKYKKKTVAKYKVTVKDATKLYGTWKLKRCLDSTLDAAIQQGLMSGSMAFNSNGTGKIALSETATPKTTTESFKWTPSYSDSAAVVNIAENNPYINSSNELVVRMDGIYFYFTK